MLRESTNEDGKRFKITFSIANCGFGLPVCNLKRRVNAYRSALLDSPDSSRLPLSGVLNRGQIIPTHHDDYVHG